MMQRKILAYRVRLAADSKPARRLVLVLLALATGGGILLSLHANPLKRRLHLLALERSCSEFAGPSGRPVWIGDPSLASQMRFADPSFEPEPWDGFHTGPARFVFAPWDELFRSLEGVGPPGFLVGMLTNPNGEKRIVGISCEQLFLSAGESEISGTSSLIVPGSLMSNPASRHVGWRLKPISIPAGGFITIGHVGVDKLDPSRFVMPYTWESGGGVLEGRLAQDDTITLALRSHWNSPAAVRAPASPQRVRTVAATGPSNDQRATAGPPAPMIPPAAQPRLGPFERWSRRPALTRPVGKEE